MRKENYYRGMKIEGAACPVEVVKGDDGELLYLDPVPRTVPRYGAVSPSLDEIGERMKVLQRKIEEVAAFVRKQRS